MSRADALDVSVVLPVYGCADALPELHRRLTRVLEGQGWQGELVFVDDCSPDGAAAVLQRLAAGDTRVSSLRMSRRSGQGRATLRGIESARGRAVVVMDADLQDEAEALPRLVGGLQPDVHAVFAARRGRYEGRGRRLTGRAFKYLLHLATGIPADVGSFVAMDRLAVERLLALRARRPYLLGMIACAGLRVTSVPVERGPRVGGVSGYGSWRRLRVSMSALASLPVWKLRAMRAARGG